MLGLRAVATRTVVRKKSSCTRSVSLDSPRLRGFRAVERGGSEAHQLKQQKKRGYMYDVKKKKNEATHIWLSYTRYGVEKGTSTSMSIVHAIRMDQRIASITSKGVHPR